MTGSWNPLKDLGEEWEATVSVWGKLKVLLFYSYVWLGIFMCTYQIFNPWSYGYDCALAESTEQQDEQAFILRQSLIYKVAWLLYLVRGKTALPNMAVLPSVLLICTLFGNLWEGGYIFRDICRDLYVNTMWFWLGCPLLALACAYIELLVDGRTGDISEENYDSGTVPLIS